MVTEGTTGPEARPVKPPAAAETVLEGVVIAVAWGPSGEVLDVGLLTFDEAEYRIDPGLARDRLLRDCLRQHVRLSAVLRDGRVIEVTRVEVLGGPEPGAR